MKNIKIRFNNITLYLLLISLLCGYIKYAFAILFIVLFHELGHVVISFILGYKIDEIIIYPFGGLTKINKPLNDSILKDLLIALFGVLFQTLLIPFLEKGTFIYNANISIAIFNLLPIIPLDGSKVLKELLSIFLPYKLVLKIYPFFSIVGIIIFILYSYNGGLNSYLIIALFITKTIASIKEKNLIYNKFILEKILYNFKHNKVDNNKNIGKYKKDTDYYYFVGKRVIDDHEYLNTHYIDN